MTEHFDSFVNQIPNCDKIQQRVIEHYSQLNDVINDNLEQRITKFHLILVMIGTYVMITHIVPWIRNSLWQMSFVTMFLKLLMNVPIIGFLVKKGIKQGHVQIYDAMDGMLYDIIKEIYE